jgi:uncharacterized protein YjiS (DUF1127 family)
VIVLSLTYGEIHSYVQALEAYRLQSYRRRRGTKLCWFTMSILSNVTDTAPIAVQRSTRNFGRGVFRVINNFVAAIIAQRERQANLTILRSLSDRELGDMGLTRSQIAGGLVEAAKERAWLQRLMTERSPSTGEVSASCQSRAAKAAPSIPRR